MTLSAHRTAGLKLQLDDFLLMGIALRRARLPTIVVQEGGYDMQNVGAAVANVSAAAACLSQQLLVLLTFVAAGAAGAGRRHGGGLAEAAAAGHVGADAANAVCIQEDSHCSCPEKSVLTRCAGWRWRRSASRDSRSRGRRSCPSP